MTRHMQQIHTADGHPLLHGSMLEAMRPEKKNERQGHHLSAKNIFLYAIIIVPALIIAALAFSNLHFNGNPKDGVPTGASALPAVVDALQPDPMLNDKPVFHYIEIIDGCDFEYSGECVNMRLGPSTSSEVAVRLRTGIVLKVEEKTVPGDGHDWYKIIFDGEIRYPERVKGDWYVAVDPTSVRPFDNAGDILLKKGDPFTTKRIVVDLSKETLTAYDGDSVFMEEPISTGLDSTPTPPGTFTVFKKTPSRYMQGPIPDLSDQAYDLPGVPWNLYFTADGAVIHGAYWHNHFGEPWSHGCVNLSPQNAKKLYEWADIGTAVIVQN